MFAEQSKCKLKRKCNDVFVTCDQKHRLHLRLGRSINKFALASLLAWVGQSKRFFGKSLASDGSLVFLRTFDSIKNLLSLKNKKINNFNPYLVQNELK